MQRLPVGRVQLVFHRVSHHERFSFINSHLIVPQHSDFWRCDGRHDCIRCRRCWKTSPCNPSGLSVIFVEIPAFNHSNSAMQKRIPDFYFQSGYSHFVSRSYLFILKIVNNSLESSIAEVKCAKCTSPWNLSGCKGYSRWDTRSHLTIPT